MAKTPKYKILEIDSYLTPFEKDIALRMELYRKKKKELLGKTGTLTDFAGGYKYFGFHRTDTGWVYREWAPAAEKMFLTGDFNGWNTESHPLTKLENGVFEIQIEGSDTIRVGQKIQAIVIHEGRFLRRIPLYATRVVQDSETYLWCAEIEDTLAPYAWTDKEFIPEKTPLIYECHLGMAGEEGMVSSYREFRENVLRFLCYYDTILLDLQSSLFFTR